MTKLELPAKTRASLPGLSPAFSMKNSTVKAT